MMRNQVWSDFGWLGPQVGRTARCTSTPIFLLSDAVKSGKFKNKALMTAAQDNKGNIKFAATSPHMLVSGHDLVWTKQTHWMRILCWTILSPHLIPIWRPTWSSNSKKLSALAKVRDASVWEIIPNLKSLLLLWYFAVNLDCLHIIKYNSWNVLFYFSE